jgi:hypothetical protein
MLKLILVGALVGGVLLLGAALWPQTPDPMRDYVQMEQARLQLQQQAADQARWNGFWDVALPLAGILAGVVLAGGVFFAGLALWERRRPVERLVLDGQAVPLDRRALHAGTYAQLPYAVVEAGIQRAIAAGPQQPHTYSPHYANRQDVQGAAPAQLAAPSAYTPPTFAEMRQAGLLGPGKPLIYGYNAETGQPITGDWRLLQSGAIAGYSGEGKSNTAAFIAGQAYEQGNVKLLLCDPHATSGDDALSARLAPLGDAFLLPPAQTDGEIVRALSAARDLVRQRLINGPPHPFKLLIIVDEWTYLMSRSTVADLAADLVEMVAQEGRKTDTACTVIGQVFGARAAGSTSLRDSLQGVIVHRMKRAQARLLVDPDSARLAETLPRGRALFSRGADVIPIAIPRCNVEDLSRPAARGRAVHPVAQPSETDQNRAAPAGGVLIDGRPWWEAAVSPDKPASGTISQDAESVNFTNLEDAVSPEAGLSGVSQEAVRAYVLFNAGYDISKIVLELRGLDTGKTGVKGQAASREIQQLIREEIARRRAQPIEGTAI